MDEYLVKVSRNALLDRLRVMQSHLTEENLHSDAMTIDFVIQIMSVPAYAEKLPPRKPTPIRSGETSNWMA